jgi:hypothetical protein
MSGASSPACVFAKTPTMPGDQVSTPSPRAIQRATSTAKRGQVMRRLADQAWEASRQVSRAM